MPDAIVTPVRNSVISVGGVVGGTHITTLTFNKERPETETPVWDKTYVTAGTVNGSGDITVLYDETALGFYETLKAEFETPSADGITIVYSPTGLGGSPAKSETFKAVILAEEESTPANGVQTRKFNFRVNGDITRAEQA